VFGPHNFSACNLPATNSATRQLRVATCNQPVQILPEGAVIFLLLHRQKVWDCSRYCAENDPHTPTSATPPFAGHHHHRITVIMSATHTYIYPQTRVAGTSLLLLLLLLGPGLLPLPGAHGLLVVNNCTQQRLPLPYSRVGCSDVAGGRYALLAAEGHVDDPNASSVAIFDTATGTWSTSHLSAGRSNKCTTAWGNLAIIAGGTPARGLPKSTSVDVWDADTGLWSLQHMSIGRDLLACASAGPYTVSGCC